MAETNPKQRVWLHLSQFGEEMHARVIALKGRPRDIELSLDSMHGAIWLSLSTAVTLQEELSAAIDEYRRRTKKLDEDGNTE